MAKYFQKALANTFYALFLLVPLALFPKTSEIFEFNKMVLTYLLTVLVLSFWLLKMVAAQKIIFKKTVLDIPILIFLSSLLLSSIFSIDPRTSFLGYYSRFHGGFLSYLSYSLLYWAYTTNMDYKSTIKAIYILIASTFLSSVWAIFEHYGRSFSCLIFPEFGTFDVSCWVQDVKTRVYSTFGQPNWLAAWLVALIPITWAMALGSQNMNQESRINNKYRSILLHSLSLIFFITLLFTKSRSGILAFIFSFALFWFFVFWRSKEKLKLNAVFFFLTSCVIILTSLFTGTPWTPSLSELTSKQVAVNNEQPATVTGPALEVGGTESGKIRQIVWQGALDIWKNYPVLGSGVETFAFSYYLFRPKEHNLVSEWDYLYNRAHNEYLNFAATMGSVGLLAYLFLIASSIYLIIKELRIMNYESRKGTLPPNFLLLTSYFSGYTSILITNFFGFSVVPIAILFFLFPAMAFSLEQESKRAGDQELKINSYQTIGFAIVIISALLLLHSVFSYWYTDYLFAKAKNLYASQNYDLSRTMLSEVVKRSPKEPVYWDELADSTTALSVYFFENGQEELGIKLAGSAISESKTAVNLSPANVNLKRNMSARLVNLSPSDPNYPNLSRDLLKEAFAQAPTDAKISYSLAISHLRAGGDYENAIKLLEKTIELKPDYEKAHYSIALMYIDTDQKEQAKYHLSYILENLNPGNTEAEKELEELSD